jgi:2-polyprenyl-3-methyl-5-hydroxy-6-metoxy-1,4-benzoquinol methylase
MSPSGPMTGAGFSAVDRCWICGGGALSAVHDARFELAEYARQDPALAAYSGERVDIVECRDCGFAQPAAVPALPSFFDRMYDQRWSDEWIAEEHRAAYKDAIFADILAALGRRLAPDRRRLLDVGAHAGRFIATARRAGWQAEGLELNPKTAAFAATATGAPVHQGNVHSFDADSAYDAVTLTDVLEHIPEPRLVLRRVARYLAAGGWIAVKVPNGPAQRVKERAHALLDRGYEARLADNLVHVNHFSPSSLRRALEEEGFRDVTVIAGAPEYPPGAASRLVRRLAFLPARFIPGAVHSPLALNLQAYGRR